MTDNKLSDILRTHLRDRLCNGCADRDLPDAVWDEIAQSLTEAGVIVPPCKVGDWVWHICRGKINKAKIEECRYSASKHGHFSDDWLFHAFDFKEKEEVSFWRDDIGETVFLTREEAEAALKERSEP